MLTTIAISLGLGALLGTGLGWKLGRGYERVRPQRKAAKKTG